MNTLTNIKSLPLGEARLLRDGADQKLGHRTLIGGYLHGMRLRTGKTVEQIAAETNIPARRIRKIEHAEYLYLTLGIFYKLCRTYEQSFGGHGHMPERHYSLFAFRTPFHASIEFHP